MPDKIRKTGSFFILSTYVTSLAIAVTIFGGNVLKGAYDGTKELKDIQATSKNIQDQMGELFQFHYDTQLQVRAHDILIQDCRENMDECQKHILILHKEN